MQEPFYMAVYVRQDATPSTSEARCSYTRFLFLPISGNILFLPVFFILSPSWLSTLACRACSRQPIRHPLIGLIHNGNTRHSLTCCNNAAAATRSDTSGIALSLPCSPSTVSGWANPRGRPLRPPSEARWAHPSIHAALLLIVFLFNQAVNSGE